MSMDILKNKIQSLLPDLKLIAQGVFFDSSGTLSFPKNLTIEEKADGSKVTNIDQYLSEQFKKFFSEDIFFANWNYFSEEDFQQFSFPMIAIDPIDGTLELIKSRPEFTVSVAFMVGPGQGIGWVFNPLTEFEMLSHGFKSQLASPARDISPQLGLVSRSEWHKKSKELPDDIVIAPKGSIAFKLALLAAGACDFVYTHGDKGIWDIAAGTFICWEKGITLFHKGKKVDSFEGPIIKGPMLWCRPEISGKLMGLV